MAKVRLGRFWMTADVKALMEVKSLHDENSEDGIQEWGGLSYDPRLQEEDDEFETLSRMTETVDSEDTLTTLIPQVGVFGRR